MECGSILAEILLPFMLTSCSPNLECFDLMGFKIFPGTVVHLTEMIDEIFTGQSLLSKLSLPVFGITPKADVFDFMAPPTKMVNRGQLLDLFRIIIDPEFMGLKPAPFLATNPTVMPLPGKKRLFKRVPLL